jgi:hypothetical protein
MQEYVFMPQKVKEVYLTHLLEIMEEKWQVNAHILTHYIIQSSYGCQPDNMKSRKRCFQLWEHLKEETAHRNHDVPMMKKLLIFEN